uniref:Uncharacterized protein n=1 Tax=Rhizophora mucronata TaxID=61149 RepID=A0A2P2Q8H4_RHIMU
MKLKSVQASFSIPHFQYPEIMVFQSTIVFSVFSSNSFLAASIGPFFAYISNITL